MEEYNDDLPSQPWSEVCVCKKPFMQPNSYAVHIRSCAQFRARYRKTLDQARQRQWEPGNTTEPTDTSSTSARKKRKRPTWLDDENLEIDQPLVQVVNHSMSTQMLPPPATPAVSHAEEEQAGEEQAGEEQDEEELGCGRRKKTLSYKVRKSTDFEPSSALPPSLFKEVILERPQPPVPTTAATDTQLSPSPESFEAPEASSSTHHPAKSLPNSFGLYKCYDMWRSNLPIETPVPKETSPDLYPFPNLSSFRLGEWFWSDESEKSQDSFQKLVSIVGDGNFKPEDVRGTNWKAVNNILAQSQYEDGPSNEWQDDDGISWITRSITLSVPFSKTSAIPGVHPYMLPEFHYRSLTEDIRAKLECPVAQENFHTMGFDLRWRPGEGKEDVRTYGEMYTSKAFIDAYEELQLPDNFKDFFIRHTGQAHLTKAHEALITHCNREMFHAQWNAILDDDFVNAYRHGIVVKCHDNVDRRFYPRILTYSADYPEKILIASIKNLGTYLCPRCEVTKADVPAMGQRRDLRRRVRLVRVDNSSRRERVEQVREFLYNKKYRYSILSKAVESRLSHGSLAATDDTCAAIATTELQREYQARKRREASAEKKRSLAGSSSTGSSKKRKLNSGEAEVTETEKGGDGARAQDGLRAKTLNLMTYKYHAMGDVAPCIRLFGTTDSYSTQIPERFHRYPKLHYKRTSKKRVNRQLSRIQTRQARIQTRQARIKRLRNQILPADDEKFIDEDTFTNPYFIGKSQSNPVSLPAFIQSKKNDPAIKGFMPKLRTHLLPRIYKDMLLEEQARNKTSEGGSNGRLNLLRSLIEASEKDDDSERTAAISADAERVFFHSDRIYQHQLLHINFTSYDADSEPDLGHIQQPEVPSPEPLSFEQNDGEEDHDSNLHEHTLQNLEEEELETAGDDDEVEDAEADADDSVQDPEDDEDSSGEYEE
ncbi:hypothetical protein DFP72DRAFT_852928 [Ephemerocybe angulata]|uniref:Uncharacterized protein n=1 Tax=Ephemerocybe angulata TaxID=980116 RepID=A0A8H6LYS9_9AGAR|nr:hypothetical protein DFP72DRAFT_852928 [Tulosesus angulatus]